jgi:acyl-ACP thioesterase
MDPKAGMEYLGKKIVLPQTERTSLPPVPVRRNDIDFNRHMNNARYVQIACEYLPEDFTVQRLRVEYKTPAKAGDILYPQTAYSGETDRPRQIFISLAGEEEKLFTVMEFTGE